MVFMRTGWRPVQAHAGFLEAHRCHHIVVDIRPLLFGCPSVVAQPQEDPSDQKNPRSGPANKEGGPQLPLLGIYNRWVVEVSDDRMSHPADGYQRGQTGQQKQARRRGYGDVLAFDIVVTAAALPGPTSCDKEGDGHQDNGDAHEAPGHLQLGRQDEQRVVDLALHPDVSLSDAVHPQTLPQLLHDDEVGADEGRDLPHGHGSGGHGPKQADETEHQGQDLQLRLHGRETSAAASFIRRPKTQVLIRSRRVPGKL